MQYIIRSFDTEHGQITVEYEGKWVYAVDLPVENGAFPVGERLEEVIQGMAPTWLSERQASLASTPENTEAIQALVQPFPPQDAMPSFSDSLSETANNADIEFITQVVNEVLASKGL